MELFEQIDYYLASHINSYLNTCKLNISNYSTSKGNELWSLINMVKHSDCIRNAGRNPWKYIDGRSKEGVIQKVSALKNGVVSVKIIGETNEKMRKAQNVYLRKYPIFPYDTRVILQTETTCEIRCNYAL